MSEGEHIDVWNGVVDRAILLSLRLLIVTFILFVLKLFLFLDSDLTVLRGVPFIFSIKHTKKTLLLEPSTESTAPSASSAKITTLVWVFSSLKTLLRPFVSPKLRLRIVISLPILALFDVENSMWLMLIWPFEHWFSPSIPSLILLAKT